MKYVTQDTPPQTNVNVSEKRYWFSVGKYLLYSILILLWVSVVMRVVGILAVDHISPQQEYAWFGDIDFLDNEVAVGYDALLEDIPKLPHSRVVIIEENVSNAYSVPGRTVYLTTQLLEESNSLEEVYFVLAHEYGHMQRKDSLKHVIITLPVQVVGALLFQWNGMWSRVVSDSISNIYSREAELASDIYAVDFVYEQLWHVWCIMEFFQKDMEEGAEFMTRWSSHPLSSKRINKVAEYIKEQGYEERWCTALPELGSIEA